jgi:hypothetical protein
VSGQDGRQWLRTVLVSAGAAALLAGCGAPPASRPWSAGVVVDDPAIPVPTLSQHEVDGTGPVAPGTDDGSGPCDTAFIADMAGTFSGAPSAGDALAAWLDGPAFDHPPGNLGVLPGAPADGWVAVPSDRTQERRFTSGSWEVLARQSSTGEWLVTQAGCTTS